MYLRFYADFNSYVGLRDRDPGTRQIGLWWCAVLELVLTTCHDYVGSLGLGPRFLPIPTSGVASVQTTTTNNAQLFSVIFINHDAHQQDPIPPARST